MYLKSLLGYIFFRTRNLNFNKHQDFDAFKYQLIKIINALTKRRFYSKIGIRKMKERCFYDYKF